MQDKELFQVILGLDSPWTVAEVELDTDAGEDLCDVDHPRGTKFCCPDVTALPCYDHTDERRWRHLDSCHTRRFSWLGCLVCCPEHGVKNVSVPWAEEQSVYAPVRTPRVAFSCHANGHRHAYFADQLGRDLVLCPRRPRGQDRKEPKLLPRIGILDEKAFAKGHDYMTLLYDLDNSTVEAISEGRDADSGIACISQLLPEQIASVEAVAMDMSAAYVKATKQTIPWAEDKIVHDRFHVMQLATKAVDKVRRGEHRKLLQHDDNCLAKTKYIWLTSQENLSEKQQALLEEVFTLQLETEGKLGLTKRCFATFGITMTPLRRRPISKTGIAADSHQTRATEKVARTIKARLANVVSYCTHGITNGVAEGLNKIMSIKRRVGGYRNRENFKTAIFFYCGGLDLYPR